MNKPGKYNVYIQLPKPRKRPLSGCLSLSKGEVYLFGAKDEVLAKMVKADVTDIALHDMFIRGFQEDGVTPAGLRKLVYQEWWCAYPPQQERDNDN